MSHCVLRDLVQLLLCVLILILHIRYLLILDVLLLLAIVLDLNILDLLFLTRRCILKLLIIGQFLSPSKISWCRSKASLLDEFRIQKDKALIHDL